MTKRLGILASALMLGAAASAEMKRHAAPDIRAPHRRWDRSRSVDRPEKQPRYYGRPVSYAPAPFVPLPPLFGYGWEPW
jgi:hypothetical protein